MTMLSSPSFWIAFVVSFAVVMIVRVIARRRRRDALAKRYATPPAKSESKPIDPGQLTPEQRDHMDHHWFCKCGHGLHMHIVHGADGPCQASRAYTNDECTCPEWRAFAAAEPAAPPPSREVN